MHRNPKIAMCDATVEPFSSSCTFGSCYSVLGFALALKLQWSTIVHTKRPKTKSADVVNITQNGSVHALDWVHKRFHGPCFQK